MARPAAVLSILVEANTGKATSSLRHFDSSLQHSSSTATKAMRTHDKLNSSTHRLASSLGNAAKYAAGAAIAYVGIAQAKEAVTTTEDLAKNTLILHKNLGLTIQSASEFLSVANAWGVDSKKVGMSMKTLATQVTAAKTGTASAQKSFETFGISMKELRKLSPEQLLMRTSEGMKNAKGSTDKLTAASKLFGRGWQSLNPILGEGAKKLREQLGWARQYGATLDGHAIKSLEQLREAQIKSNLAMQGMQILFTEKIAPSLIKVGLAIANFINQIRTGKGAGAKFADVMKSVGEVLVVFYRIVRRVVIIIEGMVNVVKKVIEWFQKLPGPVKTAGAIFLWITEGPITATVIAFKTVINIIKKTINAFGWIKDAAKNTFNAISGFVSGIPGTIKSALNAVIGFINDIIDVLDKIPFVDIGKVSPIGGKGGKAPKVSPGNAQKLHHQTGGVIVPGQGSGDKVPAMLEPGEVVLNKKAVAAMGGARKADAINKAVPRFQSGGKVQHLILGGIGQTIAGAASDIAGKGASFFTGLLPQPNLPGWLGHLGGGLISGATNFIKDKVGFANTKLFGSIRGKFGSGPHGVGSYKGVPMANWVIQSLMYAARKGAAPQPTSGYRPGFDPHTATGYSEHSGTVYPHGAVDFGGYSGAGVEAAKMSVVRATSKFKWPLLAPIGFVDAGHASGTGHQRGGVVGGLPSWVHGSSKLSADQLASLAHFVHAKSPGLMSQIAQAESGGNPRSMGGAGDKGLWQIIPSTASAFGINYGNLFDPLANAIGMAKVLAGQGLGAWSTYNSGAYRGYPKGTVSRLAGAGGGGGGAATKAPPKPHLTKGMKAQMKKLRGKFAAMGLPAHLTNRITDLTTSVEQASEFAGYASSNADDSWKGKAELSYLMDELAALLALRNHMITALQILGDARDKVSTQVTQWAMELTALKTLQHPTMAQRNRKVFLRSAIGAGQKTLGGFNSKMGSLLGADGLQGIQGSGGNISDKVSSLTPAAAAASWGGSINAVAQSILGLGANAAVTDTSASSDLLRQLLQEANQRFLVSQAQYKVFGAFAGGGMASRRGMYLVGERGPELATLGPGQRVYSNQQSQSMVGSNVEVHFWEGERRAAVKVNGEFVDARIERHNRKAGRRSARALPGARQAGP